MGSSRVPGALGCAAAVALLLSGCDDSDQYVQYCADRATSVVVEDAKCLVDDVGDRPDSPYGWYYQQFPPRSGYYSDEDIYIDTTPDFLIISQGGYVSGGTYARPPGITSGRSAASSGKIAATGAPAGVAPSPTGRVIQRGGFGVAGSSSSAAKGGSSAS